MALGPGRYRDGRYRCQEGQALSEYAMVLLFIAIACVAAVTLFGTSVRGLYVGFNGSF